LNLIDLLWADDAITDLEAVDGYLKISYAELLLASDRPGCSGQLAIPGMSERYQPPPSSGISTPPSIIPTKPTSHPVRQRLAKRLVTRRLADTRCDLIDLQGATSQEQPSHGNSGYKTHLPLTDMQTMLNAAQGSMGSSGVQTVSIVHISYSSAKGIITSIETRLCLCFHLLMAPGTAIQFD
jgi:hypothetical protein